MKIFQWTRYSVGTRILAIATLIALIVGCLFGGRVLTEFGIPERKHIMALGVAVLFPTLWLVARMRAEDAGRGDRER